ncbi:hypothetical protein H4684_001624 [Desulfomicrobium macestii]|uniref:Uncharacterized protein n=1 Tax=Desulfomicrobium macestii TaxID=90731 RepID=A0ABR9H2P3_9BACT|nr:hypothetical protein [Desulfomicrobium macestii]MBE1424980.1 hypothetical protein [Desulfomicrobium macestii]
MAASSHCANVTIRLKFSATEQGARARESSLEPRFSWRLLRLRIEPFATLSRMWAGCVVELERGIFAIFLFENERPVSVANVQNKEAGLSPPPSGIGFLAALP